MTTHLDALVESLLYEGYALYPYTPGATKNATPTPFGIVYPPAYAAGSPVTFDHLRLECALDGPAPVSATVRFLQSSGDRHQAVERRIELAEPGAAQPFAFDGLEGRARLRVDGERVRVCVHNTTAFADPAAGRAAALAASLLSCHVVVRAPGGRFRSAIDSGCESVNTWPVLASAEEDTMLGAAIVLPDHPRLAPESRGNLFDSTEIEEALLLHVEALSDGERAAITEQDPAVRAMIERASAATPEERFALHGVMRPADQAEPPRPPAELPDLSGDRSVEVDGVTFHRGDTVVLRPGRDRDVFDRMVDGRRATIEKIIHDVDGRLYFAVAVTDVPGQEILRDTGRHLFFFAGEIEPA